MHIKASFRIAFAVSIMDNFQAKPDDKVVPTGSISTEQYILYGAAGIGKIASLGAPSAGQLVHIKHSR